jgi:hypothetical protein
VGIEVIEIFEASGSKKRITGVSDGADAAKDGVVRVVHYATSCTTETDDDGFRLLLRTRIE